MGIEVKDVRGRSYQLNGHAIATYPWTPWPAVVAFHSLNEWSLGGRVGYGECADVFGRCGARCTTRTRPYQVALAGDFMRRALAETG
jgi:hypothetical protein